MASLNWKQLLVAGLICAAGATGAYYLLSSNHAGHGQDSDATVADETNASAISKAAAARKRRKERKKAQAASEQANSQSSSKDSIVSDMNAASVSVDKPMSELVELLDKDSDELQNLNVEEKQKVFYALLLKGEALMNSGQVDGSVALFAKALALVPNPTDILAAFEKSLPEPIFTALLYRLQNEVVLKTDRYYEMLAKPANGRIMFEHSKATDLLGKVNIIYVPKAKEAISKGTVVFQETANVVGITDLEAHVSDKCAHCFKTLPDAAEVVSCEHGDADYCSEACKQSDKDSYHTFICNVNPVVAEAVEKLRQYCAERSKSGHGMLMLRYIAMLLCEELKGNGTAVNGPFVHYDHLPQMFPNASETDKEEASLIRAIFSASNDNMADFLTDQIYASMKATLIRAAFSFSLNNSLALNQLDAVQPFRKVIGDNQECDATAFYPLAAHLPHGCEPGLTLELIPSSGCRVQAVAQRDIAAGETLDISFVPLDEMEQAMRKEKLFLNFMLECHCSKCSESN